MSLLPGILSIEDPNEVRFTWLQEGFFRRHGKVYCPCCSRAGVKNQLVEIGPAVNGASRRGAAVCVRHEAQGRALFVKTWKRAKGDAAYQKARLGRGTQVRDGTPEVAAA